MPTRSHPRDPEEIIAVASLFGILDEVKKMIARGVRFRTLTDASYAGIEYLKEAIAAGEDGRHLSGYQGIYLAVMDRRICYHGIQMDIKHFSLTEPLAVLYTDNPKYAEYLMATFEMLWDQAIPAEERLRDLLEQGPPRANH